MDKERKCGCKGRRSCLWCEREYNIQPDFALNQESGKKAYFYCSKCEGAWSGWDSTVAKQHPNHEGEHLAYPGVLIIENFLSDEEVAGLINGIDGSSWDVSQSGRRKQNYGPKCNFKRRKIAQGNFKGFPAFSLPLQNKLRSVPLLKDYYVIEQCSLEYDPTKGSSIDPHIDDCWVWGERIVTANIIGDSVLTMLPYKGDESKYNLELVSFIRTRNSNYSVSDDIIVRIPMPAKSLLVLYGDARYKWEHCILREDTLNRRVCLTYREFTPSYLPGGEQEKSGRDILNVSLSTVSL